MSEPGEISTNHMSEPGEISTNTIIIQRKPVNVTPLKVNNRFMSTAYIGPVFSALYFSNLNPDNVNTLNNLKKPIFPRKSEIKEKNGGKRECPMYLEYLITKRPSHFHYFMHTIGLHFTRII